MNIQVKYNLESLSPLIDINLDFILEEDKMYNDAIKGLELLKQNTNKK